MATPEEIPPALAQIAYRIPEDIRSAMSDTDLRIRAEFVLELNGQADAAGSEGRARSLRRKAERVLRSMPPSVYVDELSRLQEEMAEANRGGESRRALALLEEIRQLELQHPQPPAEMYRNAIVSALTGEVDRIAKSLPPIPPAPQVNVFTRRSGKRRGR